jgi:hypothetical protein
MNTFKLFTLLFIAFVVQSCTEKNKQGESNSSLSTNETWEVTTDKYALTVEVLDSAQFYTAKSKTKNTKKQLEKITNFETANKMLKGVVEFYGNSTEGDGHRLRRILFRNGDISNYSDDYAYFVAYYPSEDVILLEGGHSSDVSYNLKNGKQTEEAGNPDYIVASPNNELRLNGFFGGQECVSYFIQKKSNGQFENTIPISDVLTKDNKVLCTIKEAFWTDDSTLYLNENTNYDEAGIGRSKFYKVSIKKALPTPPQRSSQLAKKPSDFVPEGYVIHQSEEGAFSDGIEEIKGDLNNDGLADMVLIIKETKKANIINDKYRGELDRNRRGIIILLNKKDHYKLALKNYDCFSSENEDGGGYLAPELVVSIENGNLIVHYAHGRYGYWDYTFRYQNSDFELIGYHLSAHNGPILDSETSMNFLTKKKLERVNVNKDIKESGDEVFEEKWSDLKMKELIRLSEIEDFDDLHLSLN